MKFACPVKASPFVDDPCILIVFPFVLFLFSSCCIAWYWKDLGRWCPGQTSTQQYSPFSPAFFFSVSVSFIISLLAASTGSKKIEGNMKNLSPVMSLSFHILVSLSNSSYLTVITSALLCFSSKSSDFISISVLKLATGSDKDEEDSENPFSWIYFPPVCFPFMFPHFSIP